MKLDILAIGKAGSKGREMKKNIIKKALKSFQAFPFLSYIPHLHPPIQHIHPPFLASIHNSSFIASLDVILVLDNMQSSLSYTHSPTPDVLPPPSHQFPPPKSRRYQKHKSHIKN